MARITLYVPDELKARMDAAGEGMNWSEIARPCIEAALAGDKSNDGTSGRYPAPILNLDRSHVYIHGDKTDLVPLLLRLIKAIDQ